MGVFLAKPWRLPRLLAAVPALLGYPLGLVDRGGLKACLARAGCGGLHRVEVARLAAAYATRVVPSRLFPAALDAIAAHRAAGDILILLSASPELFVPALGEALGFDIVVCTRLTWHGQQLDGALAGANCRGEEKLVQLQRLKAEHPGLPVTGYGNSPPDLVHLAHCEQAYYVNPPGRLGPRLAQAGVHAVHWA